MVVRSFLKGVFSGLVLGSSIYVLLKDFPVHTMPPEEHRGRKFKAWRIGVPWWFRGLRIQRCHFCGLGCCYGTHLIPGLGTSTSRRCSQKKKKKSSAKPFWKQPSLYWVGGWHLLVSFLSWQVQRQAVYESCPGIVLDNGTTSPAHGALILEGNHIQTVVIQDGLSAREVQSWTRRAPGSYVVHSFLLQVKNRGREKSSDFYKVIRWWKCWE